MSARALIVMHEREERQDVMREALPARRAFELAFVKRSKPQPLVAAVEAHGAQSAERAFEVAFVRRP